jgi:hypothetical protein
VQGRVQVRLVHRHAEPVGAQEEDTALASSGAQQAGLYSAPRRRLAGP